MTEKVIEPASADFAPSLAARLNRDCFCIGGDVNGLRAELEKVLAEQGLASDLTQSHPHLFANAPVFVSSAKITFMQTLISAIESVIALPQWQTRVLAQAPEIAQSEQATRGVLMGFDFHLGPAGARLIEINTNAGGVLLNLALAQAQWRCCNTQMVELSAGSGSPAQAEQDLVAMFRQEWALARGTRPLRRIAIVDSAPQAQYLYLEFLLFQKLLRRQGIEAVIADPQQLGLHQGVLQFEGEPVDMVYNRLTDFYFEDAAHAVLRRAYLDDAVVITPHPRAHALYANKHNLALLTDTELLRDWQVPEPTIALLQQGIPPMRPVRAAEADALWSERSRWFFKPASGFGSRGCYRGDKLTRKVFEQILAADYVAQELVPPSVRRLEHDAVGLKVDLRHYVYAGATQWIAARLYQGQTTNFRTPGGGFAPVYPVPSVGADFGSCGMADTSNASAAAPSNCAGSLYPVGTD